MLHPSQREAASQLLFSHWMQKQRLEALPVSCRPTTREDAYQVQSLLERQSAYPLFGWKIAATSRAGQQHIGVSGPLVGRILQERVLPPGARVALDGNLMRVAEIEFAFRMGANLNPRSQPYTMDEVLAAVASLHPAIEIPDSRYHDFVYAGECQLIADNACAHQFILGEATGGDWRSLDLASYHVPTILRRNGQEQALMGIGANVLGDPRIALTWMANELSALGAPLKKDQVITTGTCLTPISVAPGDDVEADYGALGSISAHFV